MSSSIEVSELLKIWGFEKYAEAFLENEVDLAALSLLDDEQIKQLIPHIGPQAKFKKCLSDWKSTTSSQIDNSIENIIEVYGEGVDGLTPSVTSPINSAVSSPINSAVSSPSSTHSSAQELNNKCQELISLLNSTQEGKLLLKQRLNPLGDQLRRTLTREIATEMVKHDPKAPITNYIYMHWIREIERVFPAENSSIYYTRGPEVFGRAHGRLFDAVTNLKAKYRRNKIYQPRARRSLEKTTTASVQYAATNKRTAPVREDPETTSESEADLDSKNTEIEECFEWLRSSADNYTLCDEKWAITRKRRQQSVLSDEAYPYLQEFPCLKRSWGYSLISKAAILFLVVVTTVSGRIIQLRTNPHEMVLMPTLSNGCPLALEPAPLICKFMQPEDLHYKPPLIAPSTYIPPLVVEKCDSPQLEIELPAPVEKKPRVIPSAPVLPPITIPKFPIPVVIEEPIPVSVPIVEPCEPAFIPESPAMDIPVAPALPPIVMPTLPEIVVQPEPYMDEVVPEVPMVVPQPPELPAFIMPELPVLVEAPMPEPCLEDQPIPVPMPEYILPAPMPLPIVEPAFVPEMPVLNIPAAPELPPLEMPALPEIVVQPEPCLDEVIVPEIPYRPVVVPQPPELPTVVMPELPVRVEAAMSEPCLDDQLIPVAPLPEYIPMPLPAPLPLPLAEPREPVYIPQLPVNIPMAPALPPFAMPALPKIVAQPILQALKPEDPCLNGEIALVVPQPAKLPEPIAMPVYPASALADPCEPSARPVMAELPPYFVRHLPHKPMQPGHTFYPGGAYMNDHLPAMGAYPYVHHLQ